MSGFNVALVMSLVVAAWVCASWGASGLWMFLAARRYVEDDVHAGMGTLRLAAWVGSALLGAAGALLAAGLVAFG